MTHDDNKQTLHNYKFGRTNDERPSDQLSSISACSTRKKCPPKRPRLHSCCQIANRGSGGVGGRIEVVKGDQGGPAIFAWVLKHVLRKQHRCTAETQAQGYGAERRFDDDDDDDGEQQQQRSNRCYTGWFCEPFAQFGRLTRENESVLVR